MQTEWADNCVSVTVYYRKEELKEIKEWLKKNYTKSIKSVSFLLHTDHNFPLPPYEEITEEESDVALAKIDFSVRLAHENGNHELDLDECNGGACPIK